MLCCVMCGKKFNKIDNKKNVNVPLQVLRDGCAQEPEWLHCSHSAIHDGEKGERGVSPEVHYHLHFKLIYHYHLQFKLIICQIS